MERIQSAWRWLAHPGKTLTSRALNAGVWAYALTLSVRGLRTVRVVVLARLLSPEDFGLMGIAMLALGFLNSFTTTGFDKALIQREGSIRKHLDAAWTVSIIRGLVLSLTVLLSAPLVASFFQEPAALNILRVMAASTFIAGFKNVGVIYFDRELEFRKRFAFRLVPHVIELAVAVPVALMLRSVWALVFGILARQISLVVASYVAHPYRPRLSSDTHRALELYRFGVWILASAILSYVVLNLDDIVVGRVLGATMLGFYTTAFTLSSFTGRQMTGVISQVAFPAYSKLQGDTPRLRSAYMRTLRVVAVIAFPIAAGLWFVGPQFVETFMGSKWLPMIPAFTVLLVWGLMRSIGATAGPVLMAVGRPDINTKVQLATVALLATAIYPFTTHWGILGAAWATVVAGLVPIVFLMLLAGRRLSTSRWAVTRVMSVPAASTALMLAILIAVRSTIASPAGPWLLLWAPILGVLVYLAGIVGARRFVKYPLG